MKTKILGAWAGGCAVGFATAVVVLSSGCIGKARADTTTTVACSSSDKATLTLSNPDPAQLATISAVELVEGGSLGGRLAQTIPDLSIRDGVVTAGCSSPGNSVVFAQR